MARRRGGKNGGEKGSIFGGLAVLAGIGGIVWAFLSAQPSSGGPYFQNLMTQINGLSAAYSQGAITQAQMQTQMNSMKVQVQSARAAGQITDTDVLTLNAAFPA